MSARAQKSVRARRAWLTGSVLVLIGACSGDVLTLGRAPDVLTPNEAGLDTSVPDTSIDMDVPEAGADADTGSDVFIEAGPPPTFGDPTSVGDIQDVDGTASTDNPTLTDDMTEIFFTSTRFSGDAGPGSSNIWTSTRATINEAFGPPVLLESGINTDGPETSSAISGDGLTLWFGRREDGMLEEDAPGVDIYVSRRATRPGTWSAPARVASLNTVMSDIPRPPALVDGQYVMPLASKFGTVEYQTYFATQSGSNWVGKVAVNELNLNPTQFENVDGFLRDNGMEFYFSSTRDSVNDGQNIFFVRAVNTGPLEHRFPASGVVLLDLNPGYLCKDPWVSPQGDFIYFTSMGDNREQIFFAERLPALP